ncbi:unnamed protein product, partial [Closterium sp. Yama58-4]
RVLQDLQQAWGQNITGWVSGGDCSLAYGVNCNAQGMVIDIYQNYQGLTGYIPDYISALDRLTFLELAGNNLTGSIPSIIGNMIGLERIDLSYNALTGSVPSNISNLSNLVD